MMPPFSRAAIRACHENQLVSKKVSRLQPQMKWRLCNDCDLNLTRDHPVREGSAVRFCETDVHIGMANEIIGQHSRQDSLKQGGRQPHINLSCNAALHIEHSLLGCSHGF